MDYQFMTYTSISLKELQQLKAERDEARRVDRRFYRKYKELDKILWAEFNMIISGPKYGG